MRLKLKTTVSIFYLIFFVTYLFIGFQPTFSTTEPISGHLIIPKIHLSSAVTTLKPNNHKLPTPDFIVGSFQSSPHTTLLIGHSATVFKHLHHLSANDIVTYQNQSFYIIDIQTLAKSAINMSTLLTPTSQDTIILMTCAGTDLRNGDASHRLIITAVRSSML